MRSRIVIVGVACGQVIIMAGGPMQVVACVVGLQADMLLVKSGPSHGYIVIAWLRLHVVCAGVLP